MGNVPLRPPRELQLFDALRRTKLKQLFCLVLFLTAVAIEAAVIAICWFGTYSLESALREIKEGTSYLGLPVGLPACLALVGYFYFGARHRELFRKCFGGEEGEG